jgi:hypothetical protein
VADERDDVARYLADHFTVLPVLDATPLTSLPDWSNRLTQALQQADVYVQLVGSVPGRKLFGSDRRPVIEQFTQARQAGKKMFLWRSADPEEIADAALREVLTAAEYCHSIQEFRETIVRLVTPPPPVMVQKPMAGPSSEEARSIFIQAGVEDADQADQLSDLLAGCNCFAQLPLQTGTPEEIRADLEENLDSFVNCRDTSAAAGKKRSPVPFPHWQSMREILPTNRTRASTPRDCSGLNVVIRSFKPSCASGWPPSAKGARHECLTHRGGQHTSLSRPAGLPGG